MTFSEELARMLAEANERLRTGTPSLLVDPLLLVTEDATTPTLIVKQHAAYLPVSTEQALDAGLLTEEQARAAGWTPYVPPPIPWHRRARWRWQSWRERAGRKVGGWLAGVDLSERDEDW